MAFDFKKEYKEFYMPKNKPGIVTVASMNYIAVRGQGDPNQEDGEYKQSIGLLYGIAFTIKMSKMGTGRERELEQEVQVWWACSGKNRCGGNVLPPRLESCCYIKRGRHLTTSCPPWWGDFRGIILLKSRVFLIDSTA